MDIFNVIQLREFLRELNVKTSGNKTELIKRLIETLEGCKVDIDEFINVKLKNLKVVASGGSEKADGDTKETAEVTPGESASQISVRSGRSRVSSKSNSSVRSELAKEAANKAELQVRLRMLEEKQKQDAEKLQMMQKEELLKIKTEIAVAEAREKAFKDSDEFSQTSREIFTNTNQPQLEEQHQQHIQVEQPKNQPKRNPIGNTGDVMDTLVSFNMKNSLPRLNLEKFDGNLLHYQAFVDAFEELICSKLFNDREKLNYLAQYTTGKPLDIVKSCRLMRPEEGYREARRLLDKRYGDPEKVAASYIESILSWPNLTTSNVDGIDEFSIMLRNCLNAVSRVEGDIELNHPKTMRDIVKKFPHEMRELWLRYVDEKVIRQKQKVRFFHLVEFIEDEARIGTNPQFGRNFFESDPITESKPKVNCNAVQQTKFVKCWYCSENTHYLDKCEKFRKLNYSQRLSFLREKYLCFKCLSKGHTITQCKRYRKCDLCQQPHNTVMHSGVQSDSNNGNNNISNNNANNSTSAISGNLGSGESNVVMQAGQVPAGSVPFEQDGAVGGVPSGFALTSCRSAVGCAVDSSAARNSSSHGRMNIVPVKVFSRDGEPVDTYAFLDPGCSGSFISRELCDRLGVQCKSTNSIDLSVTTIQPEGCTLESHVIGNIFVSDMKMQQTLELPPLFAIDRIPASKAEIVTPEEISLWPHLSGISMPVVDSNIGIMIGNNIPTALEPWEIIHAPKNRGPYAVRTVLGWMVCRLDNHIHSNHVRVNKINVELDEIKNLLHQIYSHDFKDVTDERTKYSQEDRLWMSKVQSSCHFTSSNHYEIALPFKNETPVLPMNSSVPYRRLKFLETKIRSNPDFKKDYISFMNNMLENNFAEKTSREQIKWLIPHFGVYHAQKKKVRVVFDCAAKINGASLNEELIQGPDLTTKLLEVLLRFRFGRYAYIADINKMFYQVLVPEEDRNYLGFLWWENGDLSLQPETFRMNVHLFGASSSPSIASFALQQTGRDNAQKFDASIIENIFNNFYVDDHLKSSNNEFELANQAKLTKELCAKGGFNLDKFVSNSKIVLGNVEAEENLERIVKVLGLDWDREQDKLLVGFKMFSPNNRRSLLRLIASIYDPLGIAAPFVLGGKVIMQDCCRQKLSWNDELPDNLKAQIGNWAERCKPENLSIDRNILEIGVDICGAELHLFSDASRIGFGAVAYLRLHKDDNISVKFVMGKARVTPLQAVSIPRLELTAAVLSVKLKIALDKAFLGNINHVYFWSDSTTVLKYISNNSTKFETFVANRISFIRDNSSIEQWRYVPTKQNPADEASRGVQSAVWHIGPEFLFRDRKQWPINPDLKQCDVLSTKAREVGIQSKPFSFVLQYFSDFYRLRRCIAWIVKFCEYLQFGRVVDKKITARDLSRADTFIIRATQAEVFEKEIICLGNISSYGGSLSKLKPFLDTKGIIRVGGRVNNSQLPYDVKHPIILPNKHNVTNLIIRATHIRSGHLGRDTVLAECRKLYWIINGCRAVRHVLKDCVKCKRVQGKELQQLMSDLPRATLEYEKPPFTNTGLDCFGPFYVKRGRSQIKRYGIVFVCMVVRAVHLEVLSDLSTESFINGLRRFISRRGAVSVIFSDQGTNFVGASKSIKCDFSNVNFEKIGDGLLSGNIEWKFNTPCASHHGGIWERQIRTIRKIFSSILELQTLSDDSLQTLFCEVETIINSRPITTVSSDSNDPLPLTPSMLLTLKSSQPGVLDQCFDSYSRCRWRQVQHLSNVFWKRWTHEYISSLQSRQKWDKHKREIQVGDIVLVTDLSRPRLQWPLAKIVGVKRSQDGVARSAVLKCQGKEMFRPITKLIMLIES